MFMLIRNGMTSMFELEEYYTLDEALKLHALMSMQIDVISIHAPAKGATAFINIFSLAVRLFFISSHQ